MFRSFLRPLPFLVAIASGVGGITGCATSNSRAPAPSAAIDARAGQTGLLTREAAMLRARQIHNVGYTVWLAFDEASETFRGRTQITFEARDTGFHAVRRLRLDFTGGEIATFAVNGKSWDAKKIAERGNGEYVEIPKEDLVPGRNRVEVAYTHPFSKSADGLYRFRDPEDGKTYIHSHLEPYHAHLIFPCFDQPDLKARFDVTVEAPAEWTVVSNAPLRERTKVDGRISSRFATSPIMSTYLFAALAGPWKEWKSETGNIPLGLYARASQAKYVDAPEWFRITRKGLEFYSEFFGHPYPFAKYDQILVPDSNSGAMENIGAVTFNERAIFRGPATEDEKHARANTILHEMAHMWFGDLVTMRWWNGLWLNESFATYMASVAQERTGLYPTAPQGFFSDMKRWAYGEDQMPTTHPIEVSVADTNQATANFDGITYGKGAAALKQLHYAIGDDDFQEGLNRYFTRFANKNTSLADFMNVIGQSSERPLGAWTQAWLRTFGYNRIAVEVACDESGKIAKLGFTQKTSGAKRADGSANPIRPHRFAVGLYYRDAKGRLARKGEPLKMGLDGERDSLEAAVGKKCPDLVFPNEGDYGYFIPELDPRSLGTAKDSLAQVADPFTRTLLAFTLWEQVKAGEMPIRDFSEKLLEWLKAEKDKTLLEDLGGLAASSRNGALSVGRILDGEARASFLGRLHAIARAKAESGAGGADMQRIWFGIAVRALDAKNAEWAVSVATGKTKLRGLKLDTDLRWDLLAGIARVKDIPSDLLASAMKADASNRGIGRALEIRAASGTDPVAEAIDFPSLFTLNGPGTAAAKADRAAPEDATPVAAATTHATVAAVTKDAKLPAQTSPSASVSSSGAKPAEISNAQIRVAMRSYLDFRRPERVAAWKSRYFDSVESIAAKADDSYSRAFIQSLFPGDCEAETAAKANVFLENHPKLPKTMRITLAKSAFVDGWCAAIRAGKVYPLWQMRD